MVERYIIHTEPPPKPAPPIPVRVARKSQLIAALRQNARPIVIEDHDLARPFARLLRARELRLWAFGGLVADTMSFAMSRSLGADIEAHWYIGHYVLPGNVQKVILKPKALPYAPEAPALSPY
ncbi:MAG: hypothetical protein QOD25_2003 [Alphaproteobacteria bacterium]|nr:hypothetical protein [Alphaproteobacteria bacterium]